MGRSLRFLSLSLFTAALSCGSKDLTTVNAGTGGRPGAGGARGTPSGSGGGAAGGTTGAGGGTGAGATGGATGIGAGTGGSAAGGATGIGAGTGGGAAGGTTGAGGETGGGATGGGTGVGATGGATATGGGASGGTTGTGGTTPACTVTTDGGTLPCTTELEAARLSDAFCGRKAGNILCWGVDLSSLQSQLASALAATPAGLVQFAISNSINDTPTFCGVDGSGTGNCWGAAGTTPLSGTLSEVLLSSDGPIILDDDGSIAAPSASRAPPIGPAYVQIGLSDNDVAALDTTGVPYFVGATFPAGAYDEIVATDGKRVAAIRSDGAAISIRNGADTMVMTGSFTHVALDVSDRACALDSNGEITCWYIDGSPGAPFAQLPSGPFVQIRGALSTFCALRSTGTTTCWGDTQIDVPAGW